MTVRVLVVDHTGQEGGAELALLRVVERIGGADITVRALLLEDGPFHGRLTGAGIETAVLAADARTNRASRDRVMAPAAAARTAFTTLGFVPRLARAIRGAQCDLVVANSLKSAVLVALAAPLAGRRWVWHLHDRLAPDYLPNVLVRAMRMLALIGPRRIVVNSEATLLLLPERARRKAHLAYPGLSPEAFLDAAPSQTAASVGEPVEPPPAPAVGEPVEPLPAAVGEPVEPPLSAPTVTMIGRISPTKGQREFLEAAAILARDRPDVRFRIVGAALFAEEDYAAQITRHAESLDLGGRLELTGWVSDPSALLRSAAVLVHASPVPEPFGQVVAEAMAAGIPVVATDAGGVREMLDPDAAAEAGSEVQVTRLGILVPPADSAALAEGIARVLDDPDAAAQRTAVAREAASDRFRIESTVAAVRAAWFAAVRS
ncbi:glycosyltransferase involved in cell wall biosynthesis [Microbacterium terrae]|uniref:Alpha-D-kanosaminyltransferase n=1 Tax=Microbacterium terrae TaxID=69369 RepID=A0A0M2H8G4_9MICO|nr:glycosyltransferase [Microbacterium terrae]KJL42691.1 Alpha-D-kanosaminyltransferase [Microbacterium terrae]MBP1078596.1 glycosyltransferase involved in cell wall biosynthesis [Microbacterium terrae]GLJ97996.1 hypothetical protein GCM10017594_11930 [Microbacterium terrae]